MPQSVSRPLRRGRPPVPIATSPRITRLARAVAAGEPGAVEHFWAEARAGGTPLIEAVAGRPDERIVTFVWRGTARTHQVVLFANKLFDRSHPERSRLQHIDGTDVWHLSHRLPADWRGSYHFAVDEGSATTRELRQPTPAARTSDALRGDPYNRDPLPHPPGPDKGVATLPAAPPQPYARRRPDRTSTHLDQHVLHSALLGNERRVWVHAPAAPAGTEHELCIVLDGEIWTESIPLEPTLTNLATEGLIPPTITVFVESMPGPRRAAELCCHEAFARFLAEELHPWAREHYPVSPRAEQTTIAGQSFGGLAALFAAWRDPARFGRVLLQSPSLWWGPAGHPEWMTAQLRTIGTGALRIYQEVGTDEGDNLDANRRLRDVLQAQGTDLTYHEFTGGHDRACWLGGVADGLRALAGPTRA